MANLTKVTVSINQPVETVWDKLMNPDILKFWLTGFISAEHVSGEYGKTGAISKLKFRERGKEMEITETATAIKPNQQYSFTMSSTAFNVETDIRLISFWQPHRNDSNSSVLPQTILYKVIYATH